MDALVGKGTLLHAKSKFIEAVDCYDSALKIKPKFAEVILRESDKIFGGVSGFQNEVSDFVNLSYYINGILFSPFTKDWWDNLSKSSIIPSSWTIDFNTQTVLDEI